MRFMTAVICAISFASLAAACSDTTGPDEKGNRSEPPAPVIARVMIEPAADTICTRGGWGSSRTQLVATALDAAGYAIQGVDFEWSSSAPLVAQVDRTGLVTAGDSTGAALVSAKVDKASGTTTVQVVYCSFSCPLVYSLDGGEWWLDSGTFGGAIMRAMQRTDTDNLDRLSPANGLLRLRVANELNETDHIDALRLLAVDHPAGTRIVPDARGGLHVIRNPDPPLAAHDFDGNEALSRVSRADGRSWESVRRLRDASRRDEIRDGLVLAFRRPPGNDAHLIVDGNNTQWAAHLMGRWIAARGAGVQAWYDSLNARPRLARMLATRVAEQAFLEVSVRIGQEWRRQAMIWEAGPEISKKQIVHLDLSGVRGDSVLVRLEAPPAFWRIDAVALEAARYADIRIHRVSASRAVAHDGNDPLSSIASIDNDYLSLETGEWVELAFADPHRRRDRARSYLLRSTGWYRIHTPAEATADAALLGQLENDADGLSRIATWLLNESMLTNPNR